MPGRGMIGRGFGKLQFGGVFVPPPGEGERGRPRFGFGPFPLRSPLLGESLLVSFPPPT